jgi:hypothetical protein
MDAHFPAAALRYETAHLRHVARRAEFARRRDGLSRRQPERSAQTPVTPLFSACDRLR